MIKIHFIIITILIALSVAYFIAQFNGKQDSIDTLNQSLIRVKKTLTNHSNISLLLAEKDYSVLYYQIQLALAPNLIEKGEIRRDTLLVLERRESGKLSLPLDTYSIVLSDSTNLYNIILCTKKQN